jgi:hypothetical protein
VACDSGEEPTPRSTFITETPSARQIFGRALQGTEPVAGALVRVDASSGLSSDVLLAATSELPRTASTDASGFYRLPFGPVIYDVSVRHGRELFVMRGVAARGVEVPLGADAPAAGYRARIVPTTDPPPEPGHAVAYFVSGEDARGLTGETGSLTATFRRFDTTITLHVVEYVETGGVVSVVRAGRVDVGVRDGATSAPVIATLDFPSKKKVTFVATLPEGFTIASLAVELDAGLRTSAVAIAAPALGVPVELTFVPGLAYTIRGRATSGGAVSRSGRMVFDPTAERVELSFPPPVSAEAPIDDDAPSAGGLAPATLEAGGVLAARLRSGVLEHVLTPVGGDGPTVRIVTDARATTLPDATRMGLAQPVGRYSWTLEHFPTLPFVERLSGPNGRVAPPSSVSAPKLLDIR